MPRRKRLLALTPYRRRSAEAEAALDAVGPSDTDRDFYVRFMTKLVEGIVAWLLMERARRDGERPKRRAA